MFRKYYRLLVISFLICLCWGKVTKAQLNSNLLVQQGIELYEQGEISAAIENWQTALGGYSGQLSYQTIVLENLARAYQQLGQSDRALDYWHQAITNYQQLEDNQQLERSLTEQAQIYARLGEHQQAISILCGANSNKNTQNCTADSAIAIARQQQDKLGEAAAWGSLGETYRLRGDYQDALNYLKTSLDLAQQANLSQLEMSALNSLGNTYSSLAQIDYRRATSAEERGEDFGRNNVVEQLHNKGLESDRQAVKYLAASLQLAQEKSNYSAQLKAIINSLPIYNRLGDKVTAAQQRQQALSLLPSIPPSPDKVFAIIDLAKLLKSASTTDNACYAQDVQQQAQELLQQGVAEAEAFDDLRSQSFALGELGHFYECNQDYQQALKLSHSASLMAEQELLIEDSLYLWEWQTARIYKQQGDITEAVRAYQRAISTLDSIRSNILTANRDIQFDFRDTVEPVYRELMALQLEQVPTANLVAASNDNINSVLNVFDSLQLAELQNYFGNDCVIEEASSNANINNDAVAIFHSIMLPKRTAIIVSYPNGEHQLVWLDQNRSTLKQEIIAFNEGVVRWYDNNYDRTMAKTLYEQMVQPFVDNLQRRNIKTLVFVQDGILRNLAMSALSDGEQYLIEKYAVATTPSMTVTEAKSFDRQQITVLALGLTESSLIDGLSYPPLPQVHQEIQQIQQEFPKSRPLLNNQFTSDRLQQELEQESYSIVHIASHGRFGTEPEDTFLVTGNNQTLSITELDHLIRNAPQSRKPIELLSLTACETALGDERATLGLAGVAVQAGAKSAIASLWSLDDNVTPQVVEQFYASLHNSQLNKAQALQTAQMGLIKQNLHPAYWASFILIGNWL